MPVPEGFLFEGTLHLVVKAVPQADLARDMGDGLCGRKPGVSMSTNETRFPLLTNATGGR